MTPPTPAPRPQGELKTGAGLTRTDVQILAVLAAGLVAGLVGVAWFVYWLAGRVL